MVPVRLPQRQTRIDLAVGPGSSAGNNEGSADQSAQPLKKPAIGDGLSLGGKRRESLATIASLGHLDPAGCGNSHTAPRQLAIAAPPRKAPLGGERGYVSGHDQRGEGPDPRNQPPGRRVTVTDWGLHTADPRHIDGSGNQTAE